MTGRGQPSEVGPFGIETAGGVFEAWYSPFGLSRLQFPSAVRAGAHPRRSVPRHVQRWHKKVETAVNAVLKGLPIPRGLALDTRGGTVFQQAVWRELCRIPRGRTRTYGEIAGRLGRPAATRAVGAACGANPIPLLIPCHRVVASGGGIGGFSAGLPWKIRLLAIEGILTG